METKLTVGERFNLLTVMPKKSNIVTWRAINELKDRVSLSADELQQHSVDFKPNGSITWNTTNDNGVDFIFSEKELEIIKSGFKELDANDAITEPLLILHDKLGF